MLRSAAARPLFGLRPRSYRFYPLSVEVGCLVYSGQESKRGNTKMFTSIETRRQLTNVVRRSKTPSHLPKLKQPQNLEKSVSAATFFAGGFQACEPTGHLEANTRLGMMEAEPSGSRTKNLCYVDSTFDNANSQPSKPKP